MSVQHLKSLLFRSVKIQEEIEREHRRPWPDWMRLLKLKKIRLAIKDRIERLVYNNRIGKLKNINIKTRKNNNDNWQSV